MQPLSLTMSERAPLLTIKSYEHMNYLDAPEQRSSTHFATAGHPAQDFKTVHAVTKILQLTT